MSQSVILPIGRHHGTKAATRALGRFTLTETQYAPDFATAWHTHASAAFCLVTGGAYAERFRHRQFECRRFTVIYRPARAEHLDLVSSSGASCFIVEPDPTWLTSLGLPSGAFVNPIVNRRGFASQFLHQARDESRRADEVSAIAVEGLLLAAVADLARVRVAREPRVPAWLERVRDTLFERCTERITITDLASDAGVHPVHLAASFRRAFGTTVGGYIRARRVERAREALSRGNDHVSEIAFELGFSTPSHLARVFARHMGMSPLEYRRLHRRP